MRARREAYLLQNAAYLVYASVFSGSTAFWGCVRHVKIIKTPLINQRLSVKKLAELPLHHPREQSQSARFMPREGHFRSWLQRRRVPKKFAFSGAKGPICQPHQTYASKHHQDTSHNPLPWAYNKNPPMLKIMKPQGENTLGFHNKTKQHFGSHRTINVN